VRTKCAEKTSVGLWGQSRNPRELPGVTGLSTGWSGCYIVGVNEISQIWRTPPALPRAPNLPPAPTLPQPQEMRRSQARPPPPPGHHCGSTTAADSPRRPPWPTPARPGMHLRHVAHRSTNKHEGSLPRRCDPRHTAPQIDDAGPRQPRPLEGVRDPRRLRRRGFARRTLWRRRGRGRGGRGVASG
jgi:hypothetical protein